MCSTVLVPRLQDTGQAAPCYHSRKSFSYLLLVKLRVGGRDEKNLGEAGTWVTQQVPIRSQQVLEVALETTDYFPPSSHESDQNAKPPTRERFVNSVLRENKYSLGPRYQATFLAPDSIMI